MFTLIHPDCRYLCSAFPQFFLHFKFFCVLPVLNLFPHLFIYFLNFPAFICLEFVWDTLFALVAVQNKNWTPFSGWYAHPCLFPALYFFCSVFDIIWSTCLLSYPVCSTLCLSAVVFVLMFTESKDVFALSCLLLLFSEEVFSFCTCRDETRERSCGSLNTLTCSYILWSSTERCMFPENKY